MDTLEVTDLYMQRPGNYAHMGYGEWFNAACKLNDPALHMMESTEAKHYIFHTGLLNIPDLRFKLKEFNSLLEQ